MTKLGSEKIQKEIEKKARKRLKKKRPRMKVSGASVKQLQRIILKRGLK